MVLVAGPACALVAVVVGILVGERLGPGDAPAALATGVVAASSCLVAAHRTPAGARARRRVPRCSARRRRSERSTVSSRRRSPRPSRRVPTSRSRATLVDDPDSSRWSTHALAARRGVVARRQRSRPRPIGRWAARAALGRGRRGDPAPCAQRGRGCRRPRLARAALGIRRARAVAARRRHVARHRASPRVARAGARSCASRTARATSCSRGSDARSTPTDGALLAGFLLGDTRGVPDAVEAEFRAAGLTHLTAVSGGNVAFVLALVAPLVRRVGLRGAVRGLARRPRALRHDDALGAVGRCARSRWRGSRSSPRTSGRPSVGLRVLLLAATALLLVDPFLLHSVGFLLSCAASLGHRALVAADRGARSAARSGCATSSASPPPRSSACSRCSCPVFGSVPLVALPANLVAVPLAEPLTIWGIVAGAIDTVFGGLSPVVPRVLAVPTAALLHALLAVADVASRVPVAVDAARARRDRRRRGASRWRCSRARSLRRDARPLPAR